MPHGKRRFAKNSENVRHFRLIARSQKDPEGENPDAAPLVLEPFVPNRLIRKKDVDEEELMTIPESLQKLGPEVFGLETRGGVPEEASSEDEEYADEDEDEDELADLDEDCYFPKDGYNYNQHLRTLSDHKKKGGVGGVVLTAPRKDDPYEVAKVQPASNQDQIDVLKALDEADIYEDVDDDFFEEVTAGGAVESEVMLWGPSALENEDLPDLALFKAMHQERLAAMAGAQECDDEDCEGPTRPSEPVSSVRFDQLLDDEYGDEETGALDDEDIEGPVSLENIEAALDEYLDEREAEKQMMESLYEPREGRLDDVPRVIEETKAIIERHYLNEADEDAETSEGESEEDESKNWDCESILSTLSNVSNRPGKIGKIKVIRKPAPGKDLPAITETGSDAESEEEDAVELPDVVTERPKNETPEEKKQRKAAVKEMRRICRRMKKESKDMYKQEAAKLNSKQGSSDVREKLRCVKL